MPTLQSDAPFERMPLNPGQEPVHQIAFHPFLLLDPPYQRGSVWGPDRRRQLIKSLLLGIPVGNVFLNRRKHEVMAVVDGKQRIETILMFVGDQLDVPASWFDADLIETTHDTDDGPYVFHGELTTVGQNVFRRCSMTTQLTTLKTVEEEEELFNLINFGGLAQGEVD